MVHAAAFGHGHGWARTSDLSRVKRSDADVILGAFAGSLAADLALRARIYCRGVQGFVVAVVPGILPGTSGALLSGAPHSSGLPASRSGPLRLGVMQRSPSLVAGRRVFIDPCS